MSYIKKLIAMVLTFAMTLSMASIATIQAMQSPIEFNKSKTYAVISKTNNNGSGAGNSPVIRILKNQEDLS